MHDSGEYAAAAIIKKVFVRCGRKVERNEREVEEKLFCRFFQTAKSGKTHQMISLNLTRVL